MKKLTFLFLMMMAYIATSFAQVEAGKSYRFKDVATNQYLTARNHTEHATGAFGGVGTTSFSETNEDQIFVVEQSGSNFKLKTKTGYYIYAHEWNVDALSNKSSEVKFSTKNSGYAMQINNTVKGGFHYVKNEYVSSGSGYYIFGDVTAVSNAAVWQIEEVIEMVERTVTVQTNNDDWGTVTGGGTSANAIEITATPNSGYRFLYWQDEEGAKIYEASYNDMSASDKTYTAYFAEITNLDGKSYRLKNVKSGYYMAFTSYNTYDPTVYNSGTSGMSQVALNEESQDQIFTFEATSDGKYYMKSASGYYVYCMAWYCHAEASNKTVFTLTQDANDNWTIYQASAYQPISPNDPSKQHYGYLGPQSDNANTTVYNNDPETSEYIKWEFSFVPTVEPAYVVTVSVNDDAMGTADKQAGENDTYTLTATAKNGYEFVNWTVEGEVVSTEATYTFTAEADVAVVANFQIVAEWPATMALIETAETLAANEGVGYPNAETKAAFQAIINAAKANSTIEQVEILETAIEAYYNATDIEMPVAGNVYAFVVARSESDLMYIYNNEGTLALAAYDGTSALPESAYFTAGTSNDKLTFQSVADNKYMAIPQPAVSWLTNNSVSGLESEVTLVSEFEVLKLQSGMNDYVQASEEQLFGMVYLFGSRGNRTDNGNSEPGVIIVNSANGFDKSNNPMCGYNGTNFFTSAIRIVEVSYTPVYAVSATASPANAGEVTISATEVEENGTVELTATANTGYEFVNWTVEGVEVSDEASFTATVTAETAYVANFVAQEFTITYIVDGEEYATETYAYGEVVTPQAAPAEKEGYTFSGWSEIPETMPAENVTVTGTFAVNSYNIVYYVDGEVYQTQSVEYGATINAIAEPTKDGYTFSGWSEIPETMPAEDVEVTGTFAVNSYDIVYYVDGEVYQTQSVEYGATVTPVAEPTKDGYTFSGWSEIPETMPAENVTVTGTFAVNSYDIVYYVDGEVYQTQSVEYGATVTPIAEPTKDGYTFSGWSEIPATMPAENVTVTGSFTIVIKENVEVTDENKEENANATYANVTVANEKVWDIKANTISADKVSVSVSATGTAPQIKIEDGGQVTAALEVNRVVKKGEWAMMALPFAVDLANVTVNGVAAQNNVNIKVMVYDAAKRANESIELWTKSGWVDLQGTTIAANQGFAVAVNAQNGDEQTVTFASAPQTYDGADKAVALDRHASAVNEGADADWNFFGNPTLANAEKGTGYALYIYNAEDDSYDEYASSDAVTCQPYAAMFVQSADDFNSLNFSAGTAGALADANGVYGEMQFSLNGEDEARVVLSDEASEEYVRNEDALYFAAPNANLAQLYIVKGNIKMAVSEQPELSESIALGYKAAKAGEQTLTLTSLPDNASVVLKDNVTGDEVALTVGDSYTFESAAGTFNNRFVVTTTDLTGIAQATANGEIKVVVNGDDINVYGAEAGTEVVAYTTNGTVVASAVAEEGVTTLSTSANGVIIVKVANTAVKVIK